MAKAYNNSLVSSIFLLSCFQYIWTCVACAQGKSGWTQSIFQYFPLLITVFAQVSFLLFVVFFGLFDVVSLPPIFQISLIIVSVVQFAIQLTFEHLFSVL